MFQGASGHREKFDSKLDCFLTHLQIILFPISNFDYVRRTLERITKLNWDLFWGKKLVWLQKWEREKAAPPPPRIKLPGNRNWSAYRSERLIKAIGTIKLKLIFRGKQRRLVRRAL